MRAGVAVAVLLFASIACGGSGSPDSPVVFEDVAGGVYLALGDSVAVKIERVRYWFIVYFAS